jgi:hypothetical protein
MGSRFWPSPRFPINPWEGAEKKWPSSSIKIYGLLIDMSRAEITGNMPGTG